MAKKHRQQKNRLPLPVIALGGVLLIAAAILFALQNRLQVSGTPKLAVEPQSIDYGEVKLNTPLTFEFTVTNTGDGALRFQEQPYIEVLEGCWPPEVTISSMVLQPGESATIQSSTFMMHAGMEGPHNFGVHLVTNDPVQPDRVMNVLSDWVPWWAHYKSLTTKVTKAQKERNEIGGFDYQWRLVGGMRPT